MIQIHRICRHVPLVVARRAGGVNRLDHGRLGARQEVDPIRESRDPGYSTGNNRALQKNPGSRPCASAVPGRYRCCCRGNRRTDPLANISSADLVVVDVVALDNAAGTTHFGVAHQAWYRLHWCRRSGRRCQTSAYLQPDATWGRSAHLADVTAGPSCAMPAIGVTASGPVITARAMRVKRKRVGTRRPLDRNSVSRIGTWRDARRLNRAMGYYMASVFRDSTETLLTVATQYLPP